MSYIDLHMHSYYSDDGEFEPKQLIDLCLEKNIKYFSIADHNSVRGIKEAKEYCVGKNINIIPAIELDCTFNEINLHVLGYGIDCDKTVFYDIEDNIIKQEQFASKKRMKLVKELGIDFYLDIIDKNYTIKHRRDDVSLTINDISEGENNLLALLFFYYELFNDKQQQNFKNEINYIIIDDDSDVLEEQLLRFIQTDTYFGISEREVEICIDLLNNKYSPNPIRRNLILTTLWRNKCSGLNDVKLIDKILKNDK